MKLRRWRQQWSVDVGLLLFYFWGCFGGDVEFSLSC
jgi:hypothetical protein